MVNWIPMHLEKASSIAPLGLAQLLTELGDGENGFSGTDYGRGSASLDQFLCQCLEGEDAAKVRVGFVQQTIFWMIDDQGHAVGMVRARHCLNEQLLQRGGHVGFYVRRDERGKGYAKSALRLAVEFLKKRGVERVLVTTEPDNEPSKRVIIATGGVYDGQGRLPGSERVLNRYWIE